MHEIQGLLWAERAIKDASSSTEFATAGCLGGIVTPYPSSEEPKLHRSIDKYPLELARFPTTQAYHTFTTNITMFPVELLAKILSYLVWSSPLEADLVAATHVCRRWRIAALDDALLWKHVSATSPSKARIFFRRSKDVLLDVHISRTCDVDGIVRLLNRHRTRLRSLVIDAVDVLAATRYLHHFNRLSAPMLEVLSVDGPDMVPTETQPVHYVPNPLDPTQTHCSSSTPRLRSVCLHPFCLPWDATIYQNLTVLDLDAIMMPVPTIESLVSILHQCPDLETFKLRLSALTSVSLSSSSLGSIVHLLQLATFHLDGPFPQQIAALLARVALPPTTRLILSTADTLELPSQYPVLPADCGHMPNLSSMRAIEFAQVDEKSILIRGYRTCASEPLLNLTVQVSDPAAAVTRVANAISVKKVETLTISFPSTTEIALANWHAALQDFVNLRTLRLVGLTTNSLRCAVHALRTPPLPDNPFTTRAPPATGDTHPAPIVCRRLANLEIADVERSCRMSTDMLWLCDERRRLGCALSSIEMDAGVVSDKCVSDLRTRGVEVKLHD